MQLSVNFSFEEAMTSDSAARAGIDNTPPPNLYPALVYTANKMELVRGILQAPIHINSWYRCPRLNNLIGGVPTSQHMKGEAVDFIAPKYGIPALIAKKLFENVAVLNYDQLIMEQTWVHISFTSSGTPRNELLTFLGKGKYMPGIRDKEGNTIDFHAYGIGEN